MAGFYLSLVVLFFSSRRDHIEYLPLVWRYLKLVAVISILGTVLFKVGIFLLSSASSGVTSLFSDYSFLFNLLAMLILWFCLPASHKVESAKLLDLSCMSVLAWQGIGKFGCFSAGCCSGVVSLGDFALPLQIVEASLFLLASATLFISNSIFKRTGRYGFYFVAFYCVERFMTEFYRTDTGERVLGLSIYQYLSIVLLVLATWSYITLGKLHSHMLTTSGA